MKTIIRILLIVMITPAFVRGQCSGGTNAGALTPAPAAGWQTMTVAAGNYYTFVVAAGCMPTLDFSFCGNGGSAAFDTQLTLLDNSGAYAGGYNDDNCGLQSQITGWVPAAAGTYRILVNNYPCASSGATATLAYRSTTPASMTFTSSTCTQTVVGSVTKCDLDQQIIGIQVVTAGSCSPLAVTQFQVNMTGTTNPTGDVTIVHIYYTGTSATFGASNEFLSGGSASAAGTITVNGSQTLLAGTNYFWIAYDVNPSATTGDVLDAQCTQFSCSGVRVPAVTNPAGTRSIAACAVAPGAVSSEAFWIKANAGTSSVVNGAAINQWSDQSGNNRHATQATNGNKPTYYDNAANNVNFNPEVFFNDAAQNSANADYMDITANNILPSGNNNYAVYAVIIPGVDNLTWPGKYLFSGNNTGPDFFCSFDARSGNALNDSWNQDDLIVNAQWSTNYPVLASCNYNGSQRTMYVNGTLVGTRNGSALNAPNINTALGCQRSSLLEFYHGGMGDIVTYVNTNHSQGTRTKVETYLAIKYGLTLSHNYVSSTNVTVWNSSLNAAYNNNIIGVARDDNSALSQKQSKSTSTSADILTMYIGPAKTTNQASNTGTFTAGDQSFFMAGNNNAAILESTYPHTPVPAGICCRLLRQWLSQKTNFTNADLKLEFDFTTVSGQIGSLNAADIRLLIDDDGNFGNASVIGSPTISVSVSGFVVTITVPASTFTSGQPYFTMGSVALTTPLPITLLAMELHCVNGFPALSWSTATETNNDHFTIERAGADGNFIPVATIPGAGTSSQQHDYSWSDEVAFPGTMYYRVIQTDQNGTSNLLNTLSLQSCAENGFSLYPNPFGQTTSFTIEVDEDAALNVTIYDMLGRKLNWSMQETHMTAGSHIYVIDMHDESSGTYFLNTELNGKRSVYRIVKN